MRAQPKASHFVNGNWVEDSAGAQIEITYPGTGEVIAKLHAATPAVIDAAISGCCGGAERLGRVASGGTRTRVDPRRGDHSRARRGTGAA